MLAFYVALKPPTVLHLMLNKHKNETLFFAWTWNTNNVAFKLYLYTAHQQYKRKILTFFS